MLARLFSCKEKKINLVKINTIGRRQKRIAVDGGMTLFSMC
jgi:hypothetical protein